MNSKPTTAHRVRADLDALQAAVAASPILARTSEFPGWEAARRSADIDALILAWLHGHAAAPQRGRMH